MKKGFQSQFTWMFIFIAGALILTFFVTIGYRQQASSEQQVSVELEQHLDSIISSVLQSTGSAIPITTPRSGVTFSCTDSCNCQLGVGTSNKGTSFNEKIYFAHQFLEGDDMTLWTLSWNKPFRTANFLYITNPHIHYAVFSDDGEESQAIVLELKERIPSTMHVTFHDLTSIEQFEDEGFQDTKFILLGNSNPFLHSSFTSEQVRGVRIIPGTAQFLFKDEGLETFQEQGPSYAIDESDFSLVIAAIMSADTTMYRCGVRRAYTKLSLVSKVFAKRSTLLENAISRRHAQEETPQQCFYDTAGKTLFERLSTAAIKVSEDLSDTNAITEISSLNEQLTQSNRQKIRLGCPELY